MVRFFAMALLFGLAFGLFAYIGWSDVWRRQGGRYRAWRRWGGRPGAEAEACEPGTMHLVKRSELQGVRDAYSSAPIDSTKPLLRCGRCLATYHAESVAELDRSNFGRCVVCGGTDLAAVYVAEP